MLTLVRRRSDRARHLRMNVKKVVDDDDSAKATSMGAGTGAFAALLVEWKLAQQWASDVAADQTTLKSA